MSDSLLPPSASDFMLCLEKSTTRPTALPVVLRHLWNPDSCPATLLPHLAWALSVDYWDKEWPEETKRQAIRNAWSLHRYKGTIHALRAAADVLGCTISVSEWWETGDTAGTFRLTIDAPDDGLTEEKYYEMERLINTAKPVSRHLSELNILQVAEGALYTAAAACDGSIITVYQEDISG